MCFVRILNGCVICGVLFFVEAFFFDFADGLSLLLCGVDERVIERPLRVRRPPELVFDCGVPERLVGKY
jgi:hypothetical protein